MDRDGTGSQRNLSREIFKPISYLYHQSINQGGVPLTETNQERASLLLPARGLRFPFLDAFKRLNPQEKASYPQKNRLMHRVIHRKAPPSLALLTPKNPIKPTTSFLSYSFISLYLVFAIRGRKGRSGNGKTGRSGFLYPDAPEMAKRYAPDLPLIAFQCKGN
jgi:hypothetical protein